MRRALQTHLPLWGALVALVLGLLSLPAGRAQAATPPYERIGTSAQGRGIYAYRLGPATATRKMVVIGQMHGNERVGVAVAWTLMSRPVPPGVQLWVISTMNPDGYAANRRTNAHGVDLNRNFPSTDWRRRGAGTTTYSGPAAASEPETKAVVAFLARIKPRTTVILHQPFGLVDYSGGDRSVAALLARQTGLPLRSLGASGGNLTTWHMQRIGGSTAVTLELPATVRSTLTLRTVAALDALAAAR
jgi:protein MpaA